MCIVRTARYALARTCNISTSIRWSRGRLAIYASSPASGSPRSAIHTRTHSYTLVHTRTRERESRRAKILTGGSSRQRRSLHFPSSPLLFVPYSYTPSPLPCLFYLDWTATKLPSSSYRARALIIATLFWIAINAFSN